MSTEGTGLGIVGLELQGGVGLLECGLEVAAAPQGDGEVVPVVLVGGVGGGCALVECDGVLALAAERDSLVVDHLRQRKAGGEELEGVVGAGVVGGVEAGETEVEVGLECLRVRERYPGECGCGRGVIAGEVLLLTQGEQGCGVVGRGGDGGLEAFQGLGGGGGVDAADVVEGGKRNGAFAGAYEGLWATLKVGSMVRATFQAMEFSAS